VRNWEPEIARAYHEATKHTAASVRSPGRGLDWANRPSPYKEYGGLDTVAAPTELVRLLRWGAGTVRRRAHDRADGIEFRTYSSAGALYPIEVYVASGDLGLCHFHPAELVLRRLRREDVRPTIAAAAADAALADAEAILVLTGILWRTSWKYGARGYRHLFWDAGTMLANLLELAPLARVVTGFVDDEVNRVVAVDGEREAALALLALGEGHSPAVGRLEPERLELDAAPLSARERDEPIARELHGASRLASGDDVARYRDAASPRSGRAPERLVDLESVLRRRGSVRAFSREPLPEAQLARVLAHALDPIPADAAPCNELYAIVNNVEGLPRGTYRFEAPDRFRLLRAGDFRLHAGYLALEQAFAARAAASLFLMTALDAVLERLGNRGYRWAQLEAGIRTGRVYLGAAALRLGATASTFYDDDVSRFLAPELSPLLCVAIGRR
jgi:SagB-type dehydrogenase family enzyme